MGGPNRRPSTVPSRIGKRLAESRLDASSSILAMKSTASKSESFFSPYLVEYRRPVAKTRYNPSKALDSRPVQASESTNLDYPLRNSENRHKHHPPPKSLSDLHPPHFPFPDAQTRYRSQNRPFPRPDEVGTEKRVPSSSKHAFYLAFHFQPSFC